MAWLKILNLIVILSNFHLKPKISEEAIDKIMILQVDLVIFE